MCNLQFTHNTNLTDKIFMAVSLKIFSKKHQQNFLNVDNWRHYLINQSIINGTFFLLSDTQTTILSQINIKHYHQHHFYGYILGFYTKQV